MSAARRPPTTATLPAAREAPGAALWYYIPMAQHEVSLEITHAINIGNKDVDFPVRVDGKLLGRLQISTGSIDWLPSPNSRTKHAMSWSDFAALMKEHGYRK